MINLSHDSSIAKFLFIEMIGTAVLTLVVALSTYQGWRTIGVIAYGLIYYMLLRGLSIFHLRYTGESDKTEVSLTPRFNPALTIGHFIISKPFYNGNIFKAFILILAASASNIVGAMIGGTALMKIFKKPDGSALDDVYKYTTSYKQDNYTSILAGAYHGASTATGVQAKLEHGFHQFVAVTRAVTYESLDHYYTSGAFIEFIGICVLIYAYTVDDKYRTHAVDLGEHKTGASLGKPIAVGAAATLVAYTFADYTAGICNPAISWGIFMNHDIESSYPHFVSSGAALLYLMVIFTLVNFYEKVVHAFSSDKNKDLKKEEATWLSWGYDNAFLQFGGLFFLTLLALHSVGDVGVSAKLRPERWSTDGALFYGFGVAALIWVARHIECNHDYFHPLANISVRFVALLGYAQGDNEESKRHGEITKFIFVIIRDALAVFSAVAYYFYVSPIRDGNPHTSHFVAVGFASYNTAVFKDAVSKPGASESEAFQLAIAQGVSWPYLLAPEIIGSAALVLVTMGAVLQEKEDRKRNALAFGMVSALVIYLFGDMTTGTCNPWVSMFSLQIDGNWSEFWSTRVGLVHVAGVLTLILIVSILVFDDMYNERGSGKGGKRLDNVISEMMVISQNGKAKANYSPMKSAGNSSTAFVPNTNGGTSVSMWDV